MNPKPRIFSFIHSGIHSFIHLLILSLTFACISPKAQKMSDLDLYLSYLTGDFDNIAQVETQRKVGKQTHPYAKHVTRVITQRVSGIPADFKGVFVLEESYYKYPNQDTIVKPYIFKFEVNAQRQIVLHSMAIPERIDKKTFRNDNATWRLAFAELKESPSFKPAAYTKTERGFYIKAPNDLPGGVKFTLEETIGNGFLEVMELAEKDGKRLTPYDTPLQYVRMK
ncbi:MAG: hypothetical protein MUE30_07390 [Spirosomaceae bacterium]|jgi:hypothetical protein|nr:hypothetical protein [Spirosomataceae bacterium]